MQKYLLSIVGPTATGKTNLALKLANSLINKFHSINLINADSKQIYQELPILTGADIPSDFKQTTAQNYQYPFYQQGKINLHGIGIINTQEEWSVSQFQEFAQRIIKASWQNDSLPIVVGGTGLYHQHLFNQDTQLKIKPIPAIRDKASKMAVTELQTWLKKTNPQKWQKMNHSDQQNPRRLIRALELSLGKPSKVNSITKSDKQLTIGLTLPLDVIKEKITRRVEERWQAGVKTEVADLLKIKNSNKLLTSATGVTAIAALLKQQIDQSQCFAQWIQQEFAYAKRQITWWKKITNIDWFQANDPQLLFQAQALITKTFSL